MSNKKLVTYESEELLQRFALLRCALNILVGDGGKPGYLLRNMTLGVNEDVEFINYPSELQQDFYAFVDKINSEGHF